MLRPKQRTTSATWNKTGDRRICISTALSRKRSALESETDDYCIRRSDCRNGHADPRACVGFMRGEDATGMRKLANFQRFLGSVEL